MNKLSITPSKVSKFAIKIAKDGIFRTANEILTQKGVDMRKIREIWPEIPSFDKEIDECLAVAKKFGDDIVLGKNRDRNYNPNLKVVRELSGYGVEICYVVDQDTDWAEGLNSEGIGIVNSALFVKRDEKDFDKAKKKKAMSKDGVRIREALQH